MTGLNIEHWSLITDRGGRSSMAEHLTVDQVVAGSTPVAHPRNASSVEASFLSSVPPSGMIGSTPTAFPLGIAYPNI